MIATYTVIGPPNSIVCAMKLAEDARPWTSVTVLVRGGDVPKDVPKQGKLKVSIAGHKLEASGPVWFVMVVFGIFLVAIAYIVPG